MVFVILGLQDKQIISLIFMLAAKLSKKKAGGPLKS
jgi:hypothetical protein